MKMCITLKRKHLITSFRFIILNFDFPTVLLQDQITIPQHTFRVGEKLEAVNPESRNQICPATVVKVYDSYYFVVQIDSLEKSRGSQMKICCHSKTPTIFAVHWCQSKGLRLTPPSGTPVKNSFNLCTRCHSSLLAVFIFN